MNTPAIDHQSLVLGKLADLRGVFRNGHTDDDVSSTLGDIKKLTGVHLVVVWGFNDAWGIGGDSEMHALDTESRVCEPPDLWCDFLYSEASEVKVEDLLAATKLGRVLRRHERLHRFGEHNFTRRNAPGRELG